MKGILTIHRHLARELTVIFLLGVLIFTFILFIMQVMRLGNLLVGIGIDFSDLIWLFVYILPHFSVLTLPIAFLFSVLLVMGNLSSSGELIALKASGYSLLKISRPILVLALLLTAAITIIACYGEPWGKRALKREIFRMSMKGASEGLKTGIFNYIFRDLIFYIDSRSPDRKEMRKVLIFDRRRPRKNALTILARKGRVIPDKSERSLRVALYDGEIHTRDLRRKRFRRVRFDSYIFDFNLQEFLNQKTHFIRAYDELGPAQLIRQAALLSRAGKPTYRVESALHRKFALPAACLIFALLGIGLGIHRGNATRSRGYALCIAIVAVYYIMMRGGDALSLRAALPTALSVWLPNLILGLFGGVLLWRRMRE